MLLTNYQRYRFYEMLPAVAVWGTLLGVCFFSWFTPLAVIYVSIVFDVYWVLRVIYFSFYLIVSWRRYRGAIKIRWFDKLVQEFPGWKNKIHVIFLPIYNEDYKIVFSTLSALKDSTYPANLVYIVLSGEKRKGEHFLGIQEKVKQDFGESFASVLFYLHPENLPDEIPGKGSNIHFAEKEFKKFVDQKGWNYAEIIVSIFDIDTIIHPEYLSHLSYMYCTHPTPTRSSFQPVTLYNNNIWESAAPLRIMALGTSFWVFFSLARIDRLSTFSSHSMSFQAIVDVGGHAKNILSEDSRIFFQCWLRYSGNYEVTPLYIPVSMDTVYDASMWQSLKNLYLQQRRWAWGTEHIPYLLWEFKKHPEIPWYKKARIFFIQFEGKWSWAVISILVAVIGRLPLWLATEEIKNSVLFLNTPEILRILMQLGLIGLFLSMILSMLMMPPRPKQFRRHNYLYLLLQWILLPVSLILFSSVPCIDAITRLALGKYLGFNVSAKQRHNS